MTDPVKETVSGGEMSKTAETLEKEAKIDAIAADTTSNDAPEMPETENYAGNPQQDQSALSIFNTVILACQGSGTLMESNERQISIGIGLLASVIDKTTLQQAKAAVINRVINELAQVAGIQLNQNGAQAEA